MLMLYSYEIERLLSGLKAQLRENRVFAQFVYDEMMEAYRTGLLKWKPTCEILLAQDRALAASNEVLERLVKAYGIELPEQFMEIGEYDSWWRDTMPFVTNHLYWYLVELLEK